MMEGVDRGGGGGGWENPSLGPLRGSGPRAAEQAASPGPGGTLAFSMGTEISDKGRVRVNFGSIVQKHISKVFEHFEISVSERFEKREEKKTKRNETKLLPWNILGA